MLNIHVVKKIMENLIECSSRNSCSDNDILKDVETSGRRCTGFIYSQKYIAKWSDVQHSRYRHVLDGNISLRNFSFYLF